MPHGTEQACVVGPKMANHFWRGSVGDYRFGAITDLILRDNAPEKNLGFRISDFGFRVVKALHQFDAVHDNNEIRNSKSQIRNVFGGPGTT